MSGRQVVENIVRCARLFLLQYLAEAIAAQASEGTLGDAEILAVQATRIQKLEELEGGMRKNEFLSSRPKEYRVPFKNSDTRLWNEQSKNPALVRVQQDG